MSAENQDGSRGDHSTRLVRAPLNPEFDLFPDKDLVISHTVKTVNLAAVAAHIEIQDLTGGIPEAIDLPEEEKKRREKIIDKSAFRGFMLAVGKTPYRDDYEAGEGENEADPDKLGEAMPFPVGIHGSGLHIVSKVTDMVENTRRATHNRPDAVSVVGATTHHGLMEIPMVGGTGKRVTYFRKLFAPEMFKDVLSLDKSTRENIETIIKVGQARAENIHLVVMDRKCNDQIIQEAQDLGVVNIERIESGDLLWGLRAMMSDPENPIVMMGRGGAPEGAITMIAARALGATGQVRAIEDKADVVMIDKTPIWTPEQFVPGAPDQSMVIFSAITPNTHFGLDAVEPVGDRPNLYLVENVVIDSSGLHIIRKTPTEYPLAA
ncbi:MAG: fructose-bisphosphatase class II [Patescibacteria group bacterium]